METETEVRRSKLTKCIGCGVTGNMTTTSNDPETGAWSCTCCGKLYPFRHWKIKKLSKKSEAV